ncbi:HD domain-containing protein [Nitrosopumilus sp. K4]|uniref:HD domain-containing protein n=1 Tax=Nitrosopumilus sp. K4 TaxID=2795383 RepID=UPI001BAD313A|nr:HD domain-containing protein [Nitrosopumilus sp. K4]QUC65445.1 HD domain-containing protein [Nitrosopumilus sp. K4]
MLLDFFNIVCNLKKVPRQGWIDKLGLKKPESVSDHTFSMTMMGLIFSEIKKLDSQKVLKMCLIHDLAESITGDLTPEQISKDEKRVLEKNTMEQILNKLPENIKTQFLDSWNEFLERNTPEAKLVHEIDKLEMVLQAKIYEKSNGVDVTSFLESSEKEIKYLELKELFRKITEQ